MNNHSDTSTHANANSQTNIHFDANFKLKVVLRVKLAEKVCVALEPLHLTTSGILFLGAQRWGGWRH